mmetsp:Transcript_46843/g.146772  ORF Transcript_46843/g.146772 Transcript_46843/m.146772 type:complete len:407 (-) Transcript_46843:114-1334(-)
MEGGCEVGAGRARERPCCGRCSLRHDRPDSPVDPHGGPPDRQGVCPPVRGRAGPPGGLLHRLLHGRDPRAHLGHGGPVHVLRPLLQPRGHPRDEPVVRGARTPRLPRRGSVIARHGGLDLRVAADAPHGPTDTHGPALEGVAPREGRAALGDAHNRFREHRGVCGRHIRPRLLRGNVFHALRHARLRSRVGGGRRQVCVDPRFDVVVHGHNHNCWVRRCRTQHQPGQVHRVHHNGRRHDRRLHLRGGHHDELHGELQQEDEPRQAGEEPQEGEPEPQRRRAGLQPRPQRRGLPGEGGTPAVHRPGPGHRRPAQDFRLPRGGRADGRDEARAGRQRGAGPQVRGLSAREVALAGRHWRCGPEVRRLRAPGPAGPSGAERHAFQGVPEDHRGGRGGRGLEESNDWHSH